MSANSLYFKAANAINRMRISLAKRRERQVVSALPDYLLKDIGWPSSQSDCCTDRAR